jgi:hypothetical protein
MTNRKTAKVRTRVRMVTLEAEGPDGLGVGKMVGEALKEFLAAAGAAAELVKEDGAPNAGGA